MKTRFPLLGLFTFPLAVVAQIRAVPEFQLIRITKNLISSPQFAYTGAPLYPASQRDRWLEVEVEFVAALEFTNDLTLKYFILVNDTLLTGAVTHCGVTAGRENRSVMYVSPRVLERITGKRTMATGAVQNIAVQIVQEGVVKDELSLVRAQPQWHAAMPRVAGLVLNKNETPFAPLYWDRYAQIKTPP